MVFIIIKVHLLRVQPAPEYPKCRVLSAWNGSSIDVDPGHVPTLRRKLFIVNCPEGEASLSRPPRSSSDDPSKTC